MKVETELTKKLKNAIWESTVKQGVFGCFEVTIGWYGKERVDYITYDTKGIWRCYEIKISKSDFRSKNHNTFLGHFNYYIMPQELYEDVKNEIPSHIGVFVPIEDWRGCPMMSNIKKAKRRELAIDEQILKDSMIRSLCREANKVMKEDNEFILDRVIKENRHLKKENQNLQRELNRKSHDLVYLQRHGKLPENHERSLEIF